MPCPNCGEQLTGRPSTCPACGHELEPADPFLAPGGEDGSQRPRRRSAATPARRRWWPWALGVLALVAAGAGAALLLLGGDDDTAAASTRPSTTVSTTSAPTTTMAPATTAVPTTIEADPGPASVPGITAEPCPDAVNPGHGCIYLGVISDVTDGLFAPLGAPMSAAQEDFWTVVNESGGLDGYDVALTDPVDAHHDPQQHVEGFARLEPDIAALAQSMGVAPTRAALPRYDEADVVAVPASWWSGWSFEDRDLGLILEAGASSCVEAMNAFDAVVEDVVEVSEETSLTYAIVAFPGDEGGDYAAGVRNAAAAHGLGDPVADLLQVPIWTGGDVSEAIDTLLGAGPDVVFMAVGPAETAQIVSGTSRGGLAATYVGAAMSWNAALLGQEALMPLLEESFLLSSPWGGWATESDGHAVMRETAERFGREPSFGYVAGWASQYNLLALLDEAIAGGDLSRSGLRSAAGRLAEVDYRGMLPPKSFAGTPDEIMVRQSLLIRVDPAGPDGLAPASPFFAGSTAASFTFEAPCSG